MPAPAPAPALGGPVLPAFLLCSALLVLKMYVVAVITGQVRLRKKVRAPHAPRPGTPVLDPRPGPRPGTPPARARAHTEPPAGPVPLPPAGRLRPGLGGRTSRRRRFSEVPPLRSRQVSSRPEETGGAWSALSSPGREPAPWLL